MPRDLYSHVPVSDGLAAERTVLAAERTFLAYIRTAFAMFAAGIAGAQLVEDIVVVYTAYTNVALSIPIFGVGLRRFAQSKRSARQMLERLHRASRAPSAEQAEQTQ